MERGDRGRPFPLGQFSALLAFIVAMVGLLAEVPIGIVGLILVSLGSMVGVLSLRQRRATLRSLLAFEPRPIADLTPEMMDIELSRVATEAIDGSDPFPPYISRPAEDNRIRSRLNEYGIVIVEGNRYAGKTRAALEAIRNDRHDDILLLRRPIEKDNPLRFLLDRPWLIPRGRPCFVFVDKLDFYLDGLQPQAIDAWLEIRPKATLVATISSEASREALAGRSREGNRQILVGKRLAPIPDKVDNETLERARETYGDDPELEQLGAYLGGGAALESRYAEAYRDDPPLYGVVAAAIVAARLGITGGVAPADLIALTRLLQLVDPAPTEAKLAEALERARQEPEGTLPMLIPERSPDGRPLLRANSILAGDEPEPQFGLPRIAIRLDTWQRAATILATDQASCVAMATAAWEQALTSEPADEPLTDFALERVWSDAAKRDTTPELDQAATSLVAVLTRELERDGSPLQRPQSLTKREPDEVEEVIKRREVSRDDTRFNPVLPTHRPSPWFYRGRARNTLRFLVLATCDFLAAVAGIALGALIGSEIFGESQPFDSIARGFGLIAVPLVGVLFTYLGLYRPDARRARLPEIVNAMTIAAFVLALVAMAEEFEVGALLLILLGAIGASAAIFLVRIAYDAISREWTIAHGLSARTLFVAPAEMARRSADLVEQTSRRPMQFVGFVSSEASDDRAQLSTIKEFGKVLGEFFVDHVILADPYLPTTERDEVITTCHNNKVTVELLPSPAEISQAAGGAQADLSVPLIEIPPPYLSPFNAGIKRGFDLILGTLFCLPALLIGLPLMLILWIMGPLRNPVVGKPRLGRELARFSMYRFELAGDNPIVAWTNAILRRTHLDELPQLYNVLHGEMSLVGPRPLNHHEHRQLDGLERHRYAVKPGITGLWQVTRRNTPVHDKASRIDLMARLDLVYCRRWSPLLDFTIVLRTPWAFFRAPEPED